tara:strand:- start:44618 stop:44857 length:240 start_codon:yes stop_codon:yes gene_type:complete
MKIVIEEIYIRCKDTSFSSHYFTIHYKTGLFFWKTVEEDLIYGMSPVKFDTYQDAENYIHNTLIKESVSEHITIQHKFQ